MVPPKFADLNRVVKDLFTDDFGFGLATLTFRSRAPNGVALKVEQSRKFDDGSVSGLLEVKYVNPVHGLTIKDTWDTKNVIASEISIANRPLLGHKFTVGNNFSTAGAISGLKFKHEYVNDLVSFDAILNGPLVTVSSVFGVNKLNLGASVAYDTAKNALAKHSVAATYADAGMLFHGSLDNGSEIHGAIHHQTHDNLQSGVAFKWNVQGGETHFGFVTRYDFDRCTFLKVALDKKFILGLSYTQQLRKEVALTLSAQVDTANLSADRHRLGANLTFDFL